MCVWRSDRRQRAGVLLYRGGPRNGTQIVWLGGIKNLYLLGQLSGLLCRVFKKQTKTMIIILVQVIYMNVTFSQSSGCLFVRQVSVCVAHVDPEPAVIFQVLGYR